MVAAPHGGRLVNRVAGGKRRERLLRESADMVVVNVSEGEALDAENIAYGVYSPLEGFMTSEDYYSVLYDMRLPDDTPWTLPIVLCLDERYKSIVREGDEVALARPGCGVFAVLSVEEVFDYDKREAARLVFKTESPEHPGVARLYERGDLLVGGKITLLKDLPNEFERFTLRPSETRVLFREKGWRTIVGFQTRNAPHLGHEYLQKAALVFVDGLFVNPVVGKKKRGDFRDEVIIDAYRVLLSRYYPRDSVVLSVVRFEMRYAGPREAVFHAIIRKNFGCTHFIVGRDHAGVGNYYKPYEAQEIFSEFPDLGITPLFFREFFYCGVCRGVVNEKVCPHREEHRVRFSGTRIREAIARGERPPPEFMRPEVADVILSYDDPFVR